MSENQTFTDEDLTAFLDGEADDALAVAIGEALETDAALAARLEALDIPIAPIAQAFDALLADAPPMPALPEAASAAPQPAPRFGWGWGVGTFGTGLAAGLAVAVFTGFGQPEAPPPPGWAAFVASYQSLYTPETLASVTATEAERTAQLQTVSAALGLDLTSLPDAEGLTFKRAQVLGFNGKPLVQLAYQRADGTPVALCIIPAGPDGKPVSMGAAQGMELARWNTPGFGFLLIGGVEQAPLQSEADTFQSWSVGDAI